ncbi:hypothetical protein J2S08_000605 [Bacillus chungangensis]|uniref:Uncharacterized protein n=1 Tax=Bacillus chungangensis TaxID=587633 RepID=A0ABT9WNA4_9BACI|nr:hypothetical protein [Bacillus chungangensis]
MLIMLESNMNFGIDNSKGFFIPHLTGVSRPLPWGVEESEAQSNVRLIRPTG